MTLRDEVYARSGGHCECVRRGCSHSGRCVGALRGEWEIHRIESGGPFTLSKVVALCEVCTRHSHGSPLGPFPGF